MDDSSGRSGMQDIADYIDFIMKSMQVGKNAPKKYDKGLENTLHAYRNDPGMYQKLQDIYRHGYANILNPDPTKKRWM
jgi:hypothetical protein